MRRGRSATKAGFTLAEIVVALLVVAVGVMGIFSLFPAGLQSSRNAIDDTQTALLAEAILTDLRMEMASAYRDDAAGYVYPTIGGDVTANGAEQRLADGGDAIGWFELTVTPVVPGRLAEARLRVKPGMQTHRVHTYTTRFVNRQPR